MHHPSPDSIARLEFGGTKKVVFLSGLHFAGQVFPSQKKEEKDYISKYFPFHLEGEVRGRAKQLLLCMI